MTINQSSGSLVMDQPLPKYEGDIPKIIAEEVPQEEVVPQEGVQGQSSTPCREVYFNTTERFFGG